jgi:hypothetical protein
MLMLMLMLVIPLGIRCSRSAKHFDHEYEGCALRLKKH